MVLGGEWVYELCLEESGLCCNSAGAAVPAVMRGVGLGSSTIREVWGWGRVPLERCGAGVEYHFQKI